MTKEKCWEAIAEAHAVMKDQTNWALCVPSYTRPDFVFGKQLRRCSKEFLKSHVFIFVHADELESYKARNPDYNYIIVPEENYGVGYTREFINCWGIANGKDFVFDWDDDIEHLRFMYASTDRYGDPSTKHNNSADEESDPIFVERLLCYTAYISAYLFNKYPNLRVGNVRRQHFCGHEYVHRTLAHINKGATPRQTSIWKLKDYTPGLYFPEITRWHGDDIISAACTLQNGEDVFSIQQVGYDYVPETKSTTLRDIDENTERNHKIHEKEYNDLMTLDIKHYLRISKTYSDGSYMYGDIDWKKFYLRYPERKGFDLMVGE